MERGPRPGPAGDGRCGPGPHDPGRVARAQRGVPDVDPQPGQAADRDTLLATHLDGEVLAIDHGFPCRLIAPNRAGVLQTKWVSKVTVL